LGYLIACPVPLTVTPNPVTRSVKISFYQVKTNNASISYFEMAMNGLTMH